MHYFVTGSTGFLGRYLTSLLLAEGHAVTALVGDRDQARALADYGVRPHFGDVRDKESMRRGMRGADGLFHTAAWRKRRSRDRRTAEAVNVGGTRNVLELVREMRIPKAVMTGTVAVFSDTGGAVRSEGYRFQGTHLTVHDRTRARAHYEMALPMMQAGLPLVVVQTGAVYGPGDDSDLGRLMRRYMLGKVPLVPTRTAYSWAHVEDVAAGLLLAMEEGRIGRTYLMCGEPATLLDVVRLAGRLVGRRRGPLPVPGRALGPVASVLGVVGTVVPPLAGRAQWLHHLAGNTYLGDDTLARRELGWQRRPIEEGMPDAVRALLQDLFESD